MAKPIGDPPTLWIDSNEEMQWHYSNLAKMHGFKPEVVALPYGDFRFIANSRLVNVERKRAPNDLEGSFKDGRLASQANRIMEHLDVEVGIILIEGNPNDVMLKANVSGACLSLQSNGIYIDWCEVGQVVSRLAQLYQYWCKEENTWLTKPTLPQPSQFRYLDRELYMKVRALMATFEGLGEKVSREVAIRKELGEIYSNPMVIREIVPTVNKATIRKAYERLGIPIPDEMYDTAKSARKKFKVETEPLEDMPVLFEQRIGS